MIGLLFVLVLFTSTQNVRGGSCWLAVNKNGRCTELVNQNISATTCCESNPVGAAFSNEELDSGALFFWRVLGNGLPCERCNATCNKVSCEDGKKCVIRKGVPKCICAPRCKSRTLYGSGPVCGIDGKTYASVCRLKKRACRDPSFSLYIDYYGSCQKNCKKVRCRPGMSCVLDDRRNPHCVQCYQECSKNPGPEEQVCGSNGETFRSTCHLRKAACFAGKAIPIAYHGPCLASASCSTISCKDGQQCLIDTQSDRPRCVTCGYSCPTYQEPIEPLCASNNITYSSWCDMINDSCRIGVVLETKYVGHCGTKEPTLKNSTLPKRLKGKKGFKRLKNTKSVKKPKKNVKLIKCD